ncbi:hypothetical protein EV126DRAFT_96427 [Verticillium dahliae]|nr:hypothetical protein EV126DRAFT_96427 [Verticillium dahliae]
MRFPSWLQHGGLWATMAGHGLGIVGGAVSIRGVLSGSRRCWCFGASLILIDVMPADAPRPRGTGGSPGSFQSKQRQHPRSRGTTKLNVPAVDGRHDCFFTATQMTGSIEINSLQTAVGVLGRHPGTQARPR